MIDPKSPVDLPEPACLAHGVSGPCVRCDRDIRLDRMLTRAFMGGAAVVIGLYTTLYLWLVLAPGGR